jgi:hypothetical protein
VEGNAESTSGTNIGVYGVTASTAGYGVEGKATATTGAPIGVYGTTASPTGAGVSGINTSTTGGNAVQGYSLATSGNGIGVVGQTASPNGAGVNGVNTSTTGGNAVEGFYVSSTGSGTGVYGQSASGAGLSGNATAATGYNWGVYAQSASTKGQGVYGLASATSGYNIGVFGYTNSTGGVGVQGSSPGVAVAGINQTCDSSGACTTITGTAGKFMTAEGGTILQGVGAGNSEVFSVNSYGDAVFNGNVEIDGSLSVVLDVSKGGGSFKIDHPLDPENKYLSHSFVESPDMMNIYNGNVVTDRRGFATVVLPDYFEALNRDFRYQLTVIGQFAQAIVSSEIGQGRFTIRTNRPKVKVSWQVTGIRQDAYANAHRIPVSEDKPPAKRGAYLHPDAYGQGEASVSGSRR